MALTGCTSFLWACGPLPRKQFFGNTPVFLKHTGELQHLLLSHPDLTVRRGDTRQIKQCKEELKNLLLRPDGVSYLLCEYQRVVAWMRAHPG